MPTQLMESATIMKTSTGWVTRIDDPFGEQRRINIPFGLVPNGFEVEDPYSSRKSVQDKYLQRHLEALEDGFFDLDKVAAARPVVRAFFERTNRYNQDANSYNLKHVVERFWKRNDLHEHAYISNGDCIWALFLEGFNYRREDGSLNCSFPVSSSSIKMLEQNTYWGHLPRLSKRAAIGYDLRGYVSRQENMN